MKGIITDIQRFSLHDGPGIRTTVFLKGCNMACPWCHNPETINPAPQMIYYENNCIGCLKCVEVCPTGAQKQSVAGHIYDRQLCSNCGKCSEICFPGAMVLTGKPLTIEDVMDEVLQDMDYYRTSGGGVTLSGGEVLVQAEFARELLKRCKGEGINTAIETNLSFPWEAIEKLLEVTDLVMLDIKLFESSKHEAWTKLSNERVLENVRRLSETGIPFIVRTPVIPGVNDSVKEIEGIAAFIAALPNLEYYELLNYNPLGEAKYRGLSAANPFEEARPNNKAEMDELAAAAKRYGIPVRTG